MLPKILIIVLMILIAFNLGQAMRYLLNDRGQSNRTVKALSWRIGLSVSLFLLLTIGFLCGWYQPHGLG